MLKMLYNIFLHPLFQAFIIAFLFIAFFPLGIQKYSINQVAMATNFDQSQILFADLDHDGVSEKINTFLNLSGNAGIAMHKGLETIGNGISRDLPGWL